MSLFDLLRSVRGIGGGGNPGAGAPAGAHPEAPGASQQRVARSRSQAQQEEVTWEAIKGWVAQEKLKVAREDPQGLTWPAGLALKQEKRTIVTVWSTAEGGGDCISILRAQDNFLKCSFMSKLNIPENRIANAARYFNMANWGMNVGAFELDESDGEISFKMNYVVENFDAEFIVNLIEESHPMGLITFGRYHRMINRLIDGEDPKDLIKIIEASSD